MNTDGTTDRSLSRKLAPESERTGRRHAPSTCCLVSTNEPARGCPSSREGTGCLSGIPRRELCLSAGVVSHRSCRQAQLLHQGLRPFPHARRSVPGLGPPLIASRRPKQRLSENPAAAPRFSVPVHFPRSEALRDSSEGLKGLNFPVMSSTSMFLRIRPRVRKHHPVQLITGKFGPFSPSIALRDGADLRKHAGTECFYHSVPETLPRRGMPLPQLGCLPRFRRPSQRQPPSRGAGGYCSVPRAELYRRSLQPLAVRCKTPVLCGRRALSPRRQGLKGLKKLIERHAGHLPPGRGCCLYTRPEPQSLQSLRSGHQSRLAWCFSERD